MGSVDRKLSSLWLMGRSSCTAWRRQPQAVASDTAFAACRTISSGVLGMPTPSAARAATTCVLACLPVARLALVHRGLATAIDFRHVKRIRNRHLQWSLRGHSSGLEQEGASSVPPPGPGGRCRWMEHQRWKKEEGDGDPKESGNGSSQGSCHTLASSMPPAGGGVR
eukprot:scaffold431_cov334-Pavlova_lutheri.AAC.115